LKFFKKEEYLIFIIKFFIGSGIAPSPRAAHGSCAVDALQMVVYGGATGGNGIYKCLHFLNL
jgi:hypothetical protein